VEKLWGLLTLTDARDCGIKGARESPRRQAMLGGAYSGLGFYRPETRKIRMEYKQVLEGACVKGKNGEIGVIRRLRFLVLGSAASHQLTSQDRVVDSTITST
jgi:hypothetical protein